MAITATSEILYDGRRNVIMQFTGISNGTGQETNVTKVDISQLMPKPITVKIERIEYDVTGGVVKLAWDADEDVNFAVLTGFDELDYCNINGMVNSAGYGKTGNILLSTSGFEENSAYTIKLNMIKKF